MARSGPVSTPNERERASGPQSRPPSAISHRKDKKNGTMKATMAHRPKAPSSRCTTAHGNKKMISMSNTMKIIATR